MNKSKKILIYCPRLLDTGGIESHLKEFIINMNNEGFDLTIWIPDSKLNNENKIWFESNCSKTYLQSNKSKNIFVTLWILIKLNFQGINSLYSNGQGKSIYWIWKTLVTIPYWIHHHHSSGDENDRKTWQASYIKTLLYCNTLIACSNKNASEMEIYLLRKVNYIPCFSRKINVKYRKINSQNLTLAFLGRLIREKGIEIITNISTEPEFQYIKFQIWGKEEHYNKAYFSKYSNVDYKGSYSNSIELENIFNSIDGILLFSTHSEGLPISLLEAESAGIPWIASDIGGVSDLKNENDSNILIPNSFSYEQAKECLLRFLISLEKLETLPNKNQISNYEMKYSQLVISKSWLSIFYDISKSSNRK